MREAELERISVVVHIADLAAKKLIEPEIDQSLSLKQQEMKQRERLVLKTANELLSTKGYEAMTVDEVAELVGIAKPSLYRHFNGKESLGVAVLTDALKQASLFLQSLALQPVSDYERVQAAAFWCLTKKAADQMPTLPSQNSSLRDLLKSNQDYLDLLIEVSDQIGAWIVSAQEQGSISKRFPAMLVLYSVYARACDPVLDFLIQGGTPVDEAINQVMMSCFSGLRSRES